MSTPTPTPKPIRAARPVIGVPGTAKSEENQTTPSLSDDPTFQNTILSENQESNLDSKPLTEIDRSLQEKIFLSLCANPDLNGEEGMLNDKSVRQRFQHLRGLSEVAAYEYTKGNK